MTAAVTSTALVEVKAAENDGGEEEEVELPVDLTQLPAIPMSKSLLLINNFVSNTTRFLNHFAHECEERISKVSTNLTRVEILLAILEAKLNSIPDLTVSDEAVQAAAVQVGASTATTTATATNVAIDSEALPDAGVGAVPPPPPPPPSADDGGMMMALPPPPPPPTDSTALVVASSGDMVASASEPSEETPAVLKFKDDPLYAKYFTMQRLGMPTGAIVQKIAMDGLDPSVWSLDPEGPSPSVSSGAGSGPPAMRPPSTDSISGVLPPPPPPPPNAPSSVTDLPFLPPPPPPPSSQPPISPTSSISSRGHADSLFGDGPPPPPSLPPLPASDFDEDSDEEDGADGIFGAPPPLPPAAPLPPLPPSSSPVDDESESTGGFVKLKDDPAFAKYFTMKKMGLPDGAIQQKMMMDGITIDIFSMDPDGPSPNTNASAPSASASVPSAPMGGLPPPPAPRAALPPPPMSPIAPVDLPARPALPPPPIPRFDASDDDSDFDSD